MLLKDKSRTSTAVSTFDLIVFDLDGTVIDSAEDLVEAARHSLRHVGSGEPSFAFIKSCIGGGARNLLLRCLDDDKKDRVDQAMAFFRQYYERHCTDHTVLYPGMYEVLRYYAGKKHLALATFKIRTATLRILEHLTVIDCFDVVITADDVSHPKPDPECIQTILQRVHLNPENTLLVGDTSTDVLTGQNAGVATCAVRYGIGSQQQLANAQPTFIIDDIRELKEIVLL
jgi:phosphoglycolate phosphatase